jgi:hypothetical protein
MIIVALNGGLGNQMFQYAFGRRLSMLNNTSLLLDLSWFDDMGKDTPRKYVLDSFNIEAKIATQAEVRKLKRNETQLHNILYRIRKRFLPYQLGSSIVEQAPLFDRSVLDYSGDYYFDGYWADFRYFEDISEIIFSDFTFQENYHAERQDMFETIRSTNSVSLHIRRGDYASSASVQKYHGLLPLNYFESSMSQIAALVGDPHIFLFSDDLEWVKKNLSVPFPHTFVEASPPGSEPIDLKLMSTCKHNIISNSTFSWWAAWLNENPSKVVIAPPQWSVVVPDTAKIIPNTWKINHYE